MKYNMICVPKATLIVIAIALLVGSTLGIGNVHMTFAANRGINVQTETNQDQGCEPAGGTSGITNACIATSGHGSTETPVTLNFEFCESPVPYTSFSCSTPVPPNGCNNIGCTSIGCDFAPTFAGGAGGPGNCTTNNGVMLTSCTESGFTPLITIPCTRTEPGTGITNSGGVTGNDAG